MTTSSLQPERLALRLTAAVVALSMGGCAVLDPLARPRHLDDSPKTILYTPLSANETATESSCVFAGCIDKAVEYGETWRQHYYQSARQVELWRNAMQVPILPLSAIALYKGTYQDHKGKVVGTYALTAGTLLAATRYFGLPPQEQTYVEAADAITCTLLNARKLMVPRGEVKELDMELKGLAQALATAESEYSTFRLQEVIGLAEDKKKMLNERVLRPIERRLAFYEKQHRRARAIVSDANTSGESLRRHIDTITQATAARMAAGAADEKHDILALVGQFPSFAERFGHTTLPTPSTASTDTAGAGGGGSASGGAAASAASAGSDQKSGLAEARVAPLPGVLARVPEHQQAAREREETMDVIRNTLERHVQAPAETLRDLADTAHAELAQSRRDGFALQSGTARNRVQSALARHTDRIGAPVPARTLDRATREILAAVAKWEHAWQVEARRSRMADGDTASPTPPSALDLILALAQKAGTVKLHLVANDPDVTVDAQLKRPLSKEEQDTAAQDAQQRKNDLQTMLDIAKTNAQPTYNALKDVAEHAEKVYHRIVGWDLADDAFGAKCGAKQEAAPAKFTVTPAITEVTLAKGKPMTFLVSNDKLIPQVSLAGQNTDSVKYEVGVSGSDFTVTVTASAAIPDGQEAVLVITDASGKRKVEIKIQADAPAS